MTTPPEDDPAAEDITVEVTAPALAPASAPAEAGAEAPSLIAGRYELRDSIGRGAFGEVFEAFDRVLGRLVAVKLVPVAPNPGPEGRESLRRFQIEAQAVSRLTHPNIITVHDFGQGERFAWIVMELVIGETLADALRRTGPPPPPETARILCALLSALHAAHERGIVHRDVKPGNILLEMTLEEGLGVVRLSDFGIARTDSEERTVVGQMIGTPWVMAPEQLRGEAVDRRTDLWAAGVILYEMLTGERPFKGTMPGIFHRIQTEHPRPPGSIRAGLPPGFDAVVARALAKAPADRFATAAEMAEAIRDALVEAPPREDLPPLPGLDPEPEQAPPQPPPPRMPAAPPGRGYFVHGLALGALGGLVLGVAATRLAGLGPAGGPNEVASRGVPLAALAAAPAPVADMPAAEPPAMPEATHPAQEAAHGQAAAAPPADQPTPEPVAIVATAPPPQPAPEPVAIVATAPPPQPAPEPVAIVATAPPPQPAPEPVAVLATAAPPQPVPESVAAAPVEPPTPKPETVVATTPPAPHPPAIAAAPIPEAVRAEVRVPSISSHPPPPVPNAPPAATVEAAPPAPLAPCDSGRLRIRTGSHEGHGRIVFDWSGPVAYRLAPDAAGLGIVFPNAGCRPAVETVRPARNLLGVAARDAGAEVLLRLRPGTQPHDFRLGNRVVIDLRDPPG